jgi:hypothetical protein
MFRENKITWLLLMLMMTLFIWGMTTLFALRFEAGEMFPVYSSLRSDPLGVKGLYLALTDLPGITPERHYQGLNKIKTEGRLTLFYLGLPPGFLNHDQEPAIEQMEALAERGARVVLSFKPSLWKSNLQGSSCDLRPRTTPPVGPENQAHQDTHPEESNQGQSVSEKWSVHAATAPQQRGYDQAPAMALLQPAVDKLPSELTVHTSLRFEISHPSWIPLYTVDQRPVIVERRIGAGSLVLVADGYLFSNEAMRDARSPSLLSWLMGSNNRVVFDEFHFGVREQQGIMSLVRKHELIGFLMSLLVLAFLFVWKSAIPFVPTTSETGTENLPILSGKDQLSGLIHLLRRNLPPSQALKISFEEWDKTLGRTNMGLRDKRAKVMRVIDSHQDVNSHQDSTEAYNQITQILSERERVHDQSHGTIEDSH